MALSVCTGAGPDIARSALAEASRSNRSPGSETWMPPGAEVPSTGPLRCWTTWVSSWASVVLPAVEPGSYCVPLENHIGADRVRVGVHRAGRCGRRRIVVDPDIGEVVTEPALHVLADVGLERSAARTDHVVDRRPFFLHQLRHRAVAGLALQSEDPIGIQRVGSAVAGRLAGVDLVTLDPRRLGPQGVDSLVEQMIVHTWHLHTPHSLALSHFPGLCDRSVCAIRRAPSGSRAR